MAGEVRIGTSGFSYPHWRGVFYPAGVAQAKWLEYYAERFSTVELNNTFYAMPKAETCKAWHDRTPDDFRFVVKLNRIITHRKRLVGCDRLLGDYLAAASQLAPKLAGVLVQLPPNLKASPAVLDAFLKACPEQYRWALEFRNETWLCDEVYDVLRSHKAALVVHDMIAGHPRVVTADWVYLRYHGPDGGDTSYSPKQLKAQAHFIEGYREDGLDVLAYFNNDVGGHAMREMLSSIGTG